MPSTESISMGKELMDIAVTFQTVANKMEEVSNRMNSEAKLMEESTFYNGKNRENLSLAKQAAIGHIGNLRDFYGMCYAYVLYAYKSMIELDEALAKAIQEAYISEQNSK